MFSRRSARRALVLCVSAAALTLAFAASALAGPADPILSFTDLRSALATAPANHLQGHMLTVVDSSQEVTSIPVTILGVPPKGNANDSLIMLEATGPLIAKYGGIVAGMSGSPVYVDYGGGDKLIGAVSYGDEFTLGGTGLATPIEAMMNIEDGYSSAAPLSAPILTSGGVVNRIIVAPDPQNYAGAAAAGAFVAKPLSGVFIGGLDPSSTGYKALAAHLNAKGIRVVQLSRGLSAGGDDGAEDFTTTLTAGSSVAALATRGDLWVGGVGTVTYADGPNVLAFGHPAYWTGNTSLYMANAWIEDVWPSSYEPYKVGDPGAIRGTITQDRGNGILGKSDLRVAETTITARAVNKDTGTVTTSTVYIPRSLLANGIADSSLVSNAVYVAGSSLFDMRSQPGSALTTTTVTLLDGTTTRTVVMVNNSSESYDIAYAVSQAAATAISTLQSVLPYGIEKPQIVSVDLDGEYSSNRTDATIVGVDAPNGLKVGNNAVRVSFLQYGTPATLTVDTVLTIPAGTPLGGTISAQASNAVSDNSMSVGDQWGMTFTRKTISGLVAQLNATVPDTALVVTYQPGSSGTTYDEYGDPIDDPSTALSTVTKQILAPWPVNGQARAFATGISASILPNPVSYGGYADGIAGEIDGPSAAQTVFLYAQTAGSPVETLVATTTAEPFDGVLAFEFPLMNPYTTNTAFRIHVDGTESSTGADKTVVLGVRASVSLKSSATSLTKGKAVTFSASVSPKSAAGGKVVFERASGKKWVAIATKTLNVSGSKSTALASWKPGRGTFKVRARYLGGTFNVGNNSGAVTIKVK